MPELRGCGSNDFVILLVDYEETISISQACARLGTYLVHFPPLTTVAWAEQNCEWQLVTEGEYSQSIC